MRYAVIAADDTKPYKHVKKSAALAAVRSGRCRLLRKGVIQEVEEKMRSAEFDKSLKLAVIPRLKPPEKKPRGLVLQYPLKDDSSKRAENRRRIWGAW